MNDRQLELSLPKLTSCRRRRGAGQTRARWWFDRMRQIIDLTPAAAQTPGSEPGAESAQLPARNPAKHHAIS